MKQVVFLIFAVTFIIVGHVCAHVTEYPAAGTGDFQFVAHHEASDMKLTSGQGALKFKVLYMARPFSARSRRRN